MGSWKAALRELQAAHDQSITLACNDLTQQHDLIIDRVTKEYAQDRLLNAQEQEQRGVEDEALLQVLLKDVKDEHHKDLLLQYQELTVTTHSRPVKARGVLQLRIYGVHQRRQENSEVNIQARPRTAAPSVGS